MSTRTVCVGSDTFEEPILKNSPIATSRQPRPRPKQIPRSQKNPKAQVKPLSPRDFHFAGPGLESPDRYRPGGYHPVHIGEVYRERYRVLHKLGYGTYSTVWLARDLLQIERTRYVSLKFVVAELTGRNNEINIYLRLAALSKRGPKHPGSEHVLALLDHFTVYGVNGEHDVLVFPVVGSHLGDMFDEDPNAIRKSIKSLTRQVLLGTSLLHDYGIVHADLHKGNIAFEIDDLDGVPERDVFMDLMTPRCVPILTQDPRQQTSTLPKYLVRSAELLHIVKRDKLRIKIIDFGEAFISGQPPGDLHTPLAVRAPEAIINHLSTSFKARIGKEIDIWSIGCLIYELATSSSLTGYARDQARTLGELRDLLGPLPRKWSDSIGSSIPPSDGDISLEQQIRSFSEVDGTPQLTALLRKIFVFEPLQRPGIAEILNHPWLKSS